jgi:ABC-2 type transport system ATP-binding protein
MAVVVSVEDVSLKMKEHLLLKNINLTVDEGQICGFVGRNGCGKTMLMKCICGFVRVSEGKIKVFDKEIGTDVDFAPDTSCLIETPGFIPYYNGYQNLRILSQLSKQRRKKEELYEIMKMVGLEPNLKRSVNKYSLGMRQRLGIAQAIMDDSRLLVLDEPFNGLDENGLDEIRNLLLKMKQMNKTIILSSHNKEDINLLCDVVISLKNGEIVRGRH